MSSAVSAKKAYRGFVRESDGGFSSAGRLDCCGSEFLPGQLNQGSDCSEPRIRAAAVAKHQASEPGPVVGQQRKEKLDLSRANVDSFGQAIRPTRTSLEIGGDCARVTKLRYSDCKWPCPNGFGTPTKPAHTKRCTGCSPNTEPTANRLCWAPQCVIARRIIEKRSAFQAN